MAVTADSNVGFKGTVDTAQWAKVSGMGARYAVLSAGALKVTVGGSGDRAVTVSPGEAWGDGVLASFDTSTNLNGTAVASGTRWDTLVVRRTWQPALTPTGLAELVILPGSASKAIASGRTTDAGATTSDQPIALLRFAAGSAVVQEVVDLRVWAGQGGGLVADNTDALLYLTEVGTGVDVRGVGRYVRTLDGGGNAVWQSQTPDTGWVNPSVWGLSYNERSTAQTRKIGNQVFWHGRFRPPGVSIPIGKVGPVAVLPSGHYDTTSTRFYDAVAYITGSAAEYQGDAVVEVSTSGNVYLHVEQDTTYVVVDGITHLTN